MSFIFEIGHDQSYKRKVVLKNKSVFKRPNKTLTDYFSLKKKSIQVSLKFIDKTLQQFRL